MLNKHYLTVILTVFGLSTFGFASVNALPPTVSGNTIVCQGATTTLTASAAGTNVTYRWYDALIGGNLLSTNNPYTTAPLTATTTIYVESVEGGIPSIIRTPVLLTVLPNLDVPVGLANPTIACPGDDIALTGTSLTGATTFNWYDALIGGNLLHTGAVYNTNVTATTLFYLETVNSDGCASLRTPVTVTVLPNLDVPVGTATPPIVCPGEDFTLNGTSVLGASTFNWYDNITGGNLLHTGQSYTTNTASTTTYYLETYSGIGCPSIRTPVLVTVLPNLDVPFASPDPIVACPGETVTLTGNSIAGATDFNWYENLLDPTPVATGASYSPTVNTTSTFYLASVNGTGCESPRVPVIVTVLPNLDVPFATPDPIIACPGESVTMTGNSIAGATNFNWYDDILDPTPAATGATFTQTVNSTQTFHISSVNSAGCESPRIPVLVTVLPNIDVPYATPDPLIACPGESVTMTGNSTTGQTNFNWYDDILDPTPEATGPTFTQTVNSTQTFHISSVNSAGCESPRIPVLVTVLPNLDVPVGIANPTISCGDTPVDFEGTSVTGNTIFNWYDNLTATTPEYTGQTFTTNPTSTTIKYLETESAAGCKSIRVPVTAIVTPNLDIPIANATDLLLCPGDSTTLLGSSLNGSTIFNWFTDSNGTNLIGSVANLVVSPLTTTIYYLQTVNANGCESILTPILISVLPNIDVPLAVANPPIACPNEEVTFEGTSVTGSTVFRWYDQLIGGNLLSTDQNYTTNVMGNLTVYLETQNSTGCSSVRTPAVVVVIPNIDVPVATANPLAVCPGDSVTLSATSLIGSSTFYWYDDLLDSIPMYVGNDYVIQAGDTSQIFHVESESAEGCRSIRTPVTMIVNKNDDNPLVTGAPLIGCIGDTAFLAGVSLNGSVGYNWYDTISGGSPVGSGILFSPTLSEDKTYYLETVNLTGCKSKRTPVNLRISLGDIVVLGTTQDTTVCAGSIVNISASSLSGLGLTVYLDLPQNGNILGTGLNYVTGPILSDTSIFVQILDSLLCPGEAKEISISVQDSIKLDSPQMNCTPDDNAVIFTWDNVPYADGYEVGVNSTTLWTPIGANTFYEVGNLESGEDVTLYIRATYSGTADCITPESDEISVSCRSDEEDLILPYNTFSPNNDGKNDWWNVGNGITKHSDNEVRIFNRIGEEVFSTTGYNNTNNVFRGEGLATGSYYYVVTVPSIDFQQTGYLILTR